MTMEPDGCDVRQLTGGEGQAENSCPSWSPDGARLCFTSWRNRHSRIYIMNRDGSGQRCVTALQVADDDFPAWSPDGSEVAFGRGDHPGWEGLHLVNLASGDERRLTSGLDYCPTWSPDGRLLALRRSLGARPGIYRVPSGGGEPSFLVSGNYPSWSPLGDHVAYSENGSIWLVPVDECGVRAGAPVPVRHDPEVSDRYPCWSPDASRLAFEREMSEGDRYVRHIMTMTVEGGDLQDLAVGQLPAWERARPEGVSAENRAAKCLWEQLDGRG